ncbi:hypothetical protein HU200_020424 [Digitaria exilis]|uniref:PDZ domain-containing protein n=1 Tax=Digitaria exilis TaxID=1010633 RepID=A0A835F1Z3_9POAL|nr:hypothetical protein HU200_020424 [Digitaria exilis]
MRQSPTVGVTTRSRAVLLSPASPSEERKMQGSRMPGKKKRKASSRESEDDNNSEKRTKAADKDREDEELATAADKDNEEPATAADKDREDEELATVADKDNEELATAADQDLENEASKTVVDEPAASSSYTACSAISSPIRCPCLPLVVIRRSSDGTEINDPNINPDVLEAYFEEEEKYCSKLERERKLLTLSQEPPRTCLSSQNLLSVREFATDMTLQVAKSVIGLLSFIDGKLLAHATGFFVKWDGERKVGKLLTSAHIICSKYPSIHDSSGTREYATDAQVKIRLSHKISVDGKLLFYHEYYNIAVFEVSLEQQQPPKLLCLDGDMKYGEEVFVLGRNERFFLNIDHSRVQFMGPGIFEPNYYMYVSCRVSKCGAGGPVVNFGGKVVGMADPTLRPAFIPISVLLRCIPRLCLGLKFSSIKFLEASHREQIIDIFKIDKGLIVKQVSEGSVAEKVGIRTGDIIKCLNGEHVSTTVDLENQLLRICEDHFNKGNGLGSKVDIIFDIFSIRKELHLTKKLTVNVSDGAEVIKTGAYLVSARKGLSTYSSSGDLS